MALPVAPNQPVVCRHSIRGGPLHLLGRAETHWSQTSRSSFVKQHRAVVLRFLHNMKNLIFLVFGLLPFPQQAQSRTDCRPVTATFCQGLGYTTTPNPTGAIGYNLQQIGQMVETACSPHIAIVLCRVAVPECGSDDDSRLKPCRALCQKVKTDCESAFKVKRLYWPTRLRCESLPESNCVQVHLLLFLTFVLL